MCALQINDLKVLVKGPLQLTQNVETLMEKYNIESLRLRRKRNLAKIMYTQSSKIDNVEMSTTNIVLRSTRKVKMKKFTSKARVYNSPLYRA